MTVSTFAIALKAKLRKNGFIEATLTGQCMEPFLKQGDCALIVFSDEPSVGCLCLVELDNGTLALHRMIDKKDGNLVTKGDCSRIPESRNFSHVIGIAKKIKLGGSSSWISYDSTSRNAQYSALISKELILEKNSLASRIRYGIYRSLAWVWGKHCRSTIVRMQSQAQRP